MIHEREADRKKSRDMRAEMDKRRAENTNMTAKLRDQKDEMKDMADIIN
jgi:Tfp pilus assembly protein PilO